MKIDVMAMPWMGRGVGWGIIESRDVVAEATTPFKSLINSASDLSPFE